MPGKTKPMSQIKQLIRLHDQGKSIKFIARSLSMSKNTVKAYVKKLTTHHLSIGDLLGLEDPELHRCLHAGNPAYKDARFAAFKDRLPYFTRELNRVGVTRHLLWQEYHQRVPDGYGYSQFCFHLSQHIKAAKPSMVLTHIPAEKLYVDFAGSLLSYIDAATGEVVTCQVFVACLPYSDYGFAMAVPSQKVPDFIYALVCCLAALGGVPKVLVPDNLKAAVIKANRYQPDINRALEDLANHYGTTVLPTRPAKPKDKALVENQVKLVYTRVYAKLREQQFFDLASLNKAIAAKMDEHNHTRMQQKPWSRTERFLAQEKSALAPLPDEDFELKYYATSKVAKNGHIYLGQDKHYYSVPYQHIGTHVKVIYTRSAVRIFGKGQRIAMHPRDVAPGRYTTTKKHLCSTHQHYLDRSPAYYLGKARTRCPRLYRLLQLMFDQDERYPEQLYKSCEGLLALHRKSDPDTFARACDIAVEHGHYSYRFIHNLLTNKMTSTAYPISTKPLPKHDNVRGKDYYK